jgi:hypothetical protein
MPSWLSLAMTIADFVVQRVDRVGPVSFEPPEKQPPERSRSAASSMTEETKVPEAPDTPAADGDSTATEDPALGFQARGGNSDPSDEDDDEDYESDARVGGGGPSPSGGNGGGGSGGNGDNGDSGDEMVARAGGGGQPSSGDEPTGGSDDDDDDNGDGSQNAQCSFRAMRVRGRPTTYEV